LSIVFILGAAIGAIYTPMIITRADTEEDVKLEKHVPQNKTNPSNVKTAKKKQLARIEMIIDEHIDNTVQSYF
jgi:hypothetical protein